ncbi:MAG: redoxin domain-containing protein [Bdellovibrionales bacterium]|nr:redoxin domain-containing protein [Bdellovibrionales bacterium]
MRSFLAVCCFLVCLGAEARPQYNEFLNSTTDIKILVFLSAKCPCSQSHVSHLNELKTTFSEFSFFGVITDSEKDLENVAVEEYFSSNRFQFPIIEDKGQVLVKKFNALKTPHVVLVQKSMSGSYEIVYEGGVSDNRDFDKSRVHYLAEDLRALKKGLKAPYREGKSLGCYIRRF